MRKVLATVVCVSLCGRSLHSQRAYESQATLSKEGQAEERATELDVSGAAFVAPTAATVCGSGEFTLRFSVGASGMATRGALRISTRHDSEWDMWGGTRLQNQFPGQANFDTFRSSIGSPLSWRSLNLHFEYFPWQRMNEFALEGEPLRLGDTIDIVFGDCSGGSPGVVIQPMDESAFEQRVFVDTFGTGEFLPLPESPRLTFVGSPARELVVFAPNDWVGVNAEVARTGSIAMIQVVKNGRILYAAHPMADSASFEFVDPDGTPDGACHYIDVM